MDITFWDIAGGLILAGLVMGLLVIAGVFLGGMLVFRTKRESYEPILGEKTMLATAGNVDETDYRTHTEPEDDGLTSRFAAMEKENERLLKQFYSKQPSLVPDGQEAASGDKN